MSIRFRLVTIALLIAALCTCDHGGSSGPEQPAPPPEDPRRRVLISTDLGGSDKDDYQSMVHALLYADAYRLEGIVTSWKRGNVTAAHEVIDVYARDYPNLTAHSAGYPTPGYLHSIVHQGAMQAQPSVGYSTPTDGSNFIVECARRQSAQPLHIAVWGSLTDVAQALHDAPDIKPNVRLASSGTWNTLQDQSARDYIRREHPDLLWVEQDSSGRGIYLTGLNDESRYGNVGFVKQVLKPAGNLGRYYFEQSRTINVNAYGIKMGDTATLWFSVLGNWANPAEPNWGGEYCQEGPAYFTDCKDPALRIGGYAGARTVAKHRTDFLRDFEMRAARTYPLH